MKSRLLTGIMALMICGIVFGQSALTQDDGSILGGMGVRDEWYMFERDRTVHKDSTYFTDLLEGETRYTRPYLTMPNLGITCQVVDTNLIVIPADSIYLTVDLLQSQFSDTTRFNFVKTLTWNNQKGNHLNQAFIDSVGDWDCDVGYSAYRNSRYFMLRARATTGQRKIPGANIRFHLNGDEIGGF